MTACVCISGCGGDPNSGDLYLQRLAGALDVPIPERYADNRFAALPLGVELRIPRSRDRLSLADVPALYRCDLSSLIGERNAPMGRLQGPSQRYAYDLAVIAGIDACDSPGDLLQRIRAQRLLELPVSAFNALFGGEEWHLFVSVPHDLTTDDSDLEPASDNVLYQLSDLLAQPPVDIQQRSAQVQNQLEGHLYSLLSSRALGRQRVSWRNQSRLLERATAMLDLALSNNPGCLNGQPTEAGRVRQNVFHTFYGQGFQPQMATQGQPDRGWVLAVSKLIDTVLAPVSGQPQAGQVRQWQQRVFGRDAEAEFGRWNAAVTAHTQAWRRQLEVCGLLPGTSAGSTFPLRENP